VHTAIVDQSQQSWSVGFINFNFGYHRCLVVAVDLRPWPSRKAG